jgi:hypothetical protein
MYVLNHMYVSEEKNIVVLREPVAGKSNIFQSNPVIRMINLKANENKHHKSLK